MLKILYIVFLFFIPLYAAKVTVYVADDFKPYSYKEEGVAKGIYVDILKSIFSKMKEYKLEIKPINWSDALKKMKSEEIKILSGPAYRPVKRPYIVDYSKPFIYNETDIYCNREINSSHPKWPHDFFNLKIAKTYGKSISNSREYLDAVKNGSITIVEKSKKESLLSLIDGTVDCYADESISIKLSMMEIERENDAKVLEKIKKIKRVTTLSKEGIHIGFSKAYIPLKRDLIKKINLALKVMSNNNELNEIIDKNLKEFLQIDVKKSIDVAVFDWGDIYVSQKLDNYGVLSEIVTSAFESKNITLNYQFFSPQYAYLLTKWGKNCITFPWIQTKDRENYMYLSDAIKPSNLYLFYSKEKFEEDLMYDNFSDLQPYKVGGIEGFFYEDIFEKENLDYTSYRDLKSALNALLLGQVDIIPSDKVLLFTELKKSFPSDSEKISFATKSFKDKNLHLLFSKKCEDSKELMNEFNSGLQNIKSDGIFKKILDKYNIEEKDFYDLLK